MTSTLASAKSASRYVLPSVAGNLKSGALSPICNVKAIATILSGFMANLARQRGEDNLIVAAPAIYPFWPNNLDFPAGLVFTYFWEGWITL